CTDAETGHVYTGVEAAVRKYDGTQVLIPQFDMNCRPGNNQADPDSEPPAINTAPNFGCPNTPGGGNGQNLWYRMPSFAYFQLCDPSMPECGGRSGAYMSGSTQAQGTTRNR